MTERVAQRACVAATGVGRYQSAAAFPGTAAMTSVYVGFGWTGFPAFSANFPRPVAYANNWGWFAHTSLNAFRHQFSNPAAIQSTLFTWNQTTWGARLIVGIATLEAASADIYLNGAVVTAGLAVPTPSFGTDALFLCNNTTAVAPNRAWPLVAYLHSTTTRLTPAEAATYSAEVADAIKQGRDIPAFNGQTHYFDARDVVLGGGGTRATWTDRISALVLTKTDPVQGLSFAGRTP